METVTAMTEPILDARRVANLLIGQCQRDQRLEGSFHGVQPNRLRRACNVLQVPEITPNKS